MGAIGLYKRCIQDSSLTVHPVSELKSTSGPLVLWSSGPLQYRTRMICRLLLLRRICVSAGRMAWSAAPWKSVVPWGVRCSRGRAGRGCPNMSCMKWVAFMKMNILLHLVSLNFIPLGGSPDLATATTPHSTGTKRMCSWVPHSPCDGLGLVGPAVPPSTPGKSARCPPAGRAREGTAEHASLLSKLVYFV